MQELTSVELSAYSELLTQEENVIKKFQNYAETCEDPALKEMCEDMAVRHIKHYEIILKQMKQGE